MRLSSSVRAPRGEGSRVSPSNALRRTGLHAAEGDDRVRIRKPETGTLSRVGVLTVTTPSGYRIAVAAVIAGLAAATLLVSVLLMPPTAFAAKGCGSFHQSGRLLTRVHVTVPRGPVSCSFARHVMKRLFNGHSTHGWHCIGPQTGYAACTKAGKKIVACFYQCKAAAEPVNTQEPRG